MMTNTPSSPQPEPLPPGSTATVLAFDIGGANLKAADGRGWVTSAPFELWRRWRELPAALCSIVAARRPQQIVVCALCGSSVVRGALRAFALDFPGRCSTRAA